MKINSLVTPEVLQVFESLPDLYLLLSPELIILTASNPYLTATYKERESIRGKFIFEVFPDNPALALSDATLNLRASLEWVLAHKQAHKMALQRYDVTNPQRSGGFEEKHWMPINTPVLDEVGKIKYIIHKVVDVTSQEVLRKRAERKELEVVQLSRQQVKSEADLISARADTEHQRAMLYNVLMEAPLMICMFEGPRHIFNLVNPQYQQLVGDRPLLGRPIAEAMPELAGQPIFELLNEVYKTGKSFSAYEMMVSLDHNNSGTLGQNLYNFTYQPTRNAEGDINGILVFAFEVTEMVEVRQKVEQREQALHELNKEFAEAYEELLQTQQALQKLNQELEERVERRTQDLLLAKVNGEAERNRLNLLFMHAPVPIVILDGPELRYELVNPAYQQIFPGRELLGKPLMKALPELEGTAIPTLLSNVYQTGETVVAQELLLMMSRYQGADSEPIYWTFTFQARHNEKGLVNGVMVFAHEVTDQVIARRSIEKNAQRLQLITDAMPVLIGYLDKEEKYSFANQAHKAWFGKDPKDLLGQSVRDVVGENAYHGVKVYIDRALAGERLDFESRMPYREDFVKYIHTSFIPDIQDGKVEGFYTLVTDITDQLKARQKIEEREKEAVAWAKELATANEELAASIEEIKSTNDELADSNYKLSSINSDLDNFIYTASHDLKAPISNIEGLMTRLVKQFPEDYKEKPSIEKIVSMIELSIDRFKNTILNLTEITKLQKGFEEDITKINVAKVLEEVKLDLEQQIQETQTTINSDLSFCSEINFSEKNMRSILYNLISNAIKYRSPQRKPLIQISTVRSDGFYQISLKDNGLGIPNSQREKVFIMFKRAHTHVEGTGVGLYIVKKIVENAGGKIEIESEVGKGSIFKVYLKNI